MPDAAAAPANGGAQGQQRGGNFISGLIRMAVTWYIMKQFMGGGQRAPLSSNREDQVWPAFNKSDAFDVYVYFSEYPALAPSTYEEESPVWTVRDVPFAGPGVDLSAHIVYKPSDAVQHNGSLFAHAIFVLHGGEINPANSGYDASKILHRVHPLITFLPAPRNTTGVNLLATVTDKERAAREAAESAAAQEEEKLPRKIVSFLKPNVTIAMVDHFTRYGVKSIPQPIAPHLLINHVQHTYDPIVFFNDFWTLRERMISMNTSVTEVPMALFLHTMSQWKWQLYNQFQHSLEMQVTMGMSKDAETDEIKKVFLEGNPVFLGLTMIVSLLHSIFDMFAFKNDIGFWKNKENLTGLSVRTILINCFCQLIIFLYLLDSETSFVVLASSFVGTLIEFWKVTKAMDVSVEWRGGLPIPVFKDKATYVDSETKEHDRVAMKYLSYALYPLVAAYGVYTLVYERHKSWYSWVLSTLVGAVYTFGFILMCPQLYLNYKLKSVAHLPWRQMTYKFLNTIIDDLFAFVIKMPTLHRIACFRDDVIFMIFLYQRWIYPVDKTRANEFGYSEVPTEGAVGDATGGAAGGAAAGGAAGSAGDVSGAEPTPEPKKDR